MCEGKNIFIVGVVFVFFSLFLVSTTCEATDSGNPIIYLPGIMSSNLYSSWPGVNVSDDYKNRVWPPKMDDSLASLGAMMDISKNLYVAEAVDQRTRAAWSAQAGVPDVPGDSLREYGSSQGEKEIIDKLCEAFPDRPIYFFSYDWRRDNDENADKLAKLIEELTAGNSKKVDLVCHSMGGIVAASYYAAYKNDKKINKIVTAGTPYEGAPEVIYSVVTSNVLGNRAADLAFDAAGMNRRLKTGFISAVELIPTEQYQENSTPSYDVFREFCRRIFEGTADRTGNVQKAIAFQNSLRAPFGKDLSQTFNQLLSFPNAWFALGRSQRTIASLGFEEASSAVWLSDIGYGDGDGTVPYRSASLMKKVESLDAKRWAVFETTHNGLTGHVDKNDPKVASEAARSLRWIVEVLAGNVPAPANLAVSPKGYTVVRVAASADATVSFGGESLVFSAASADATVSAASFGKMNIIGSNDDVKIFCVDDNDGYSVTLRGTGTGVIDYSIRFFDGHDNLLDERNFMGFQVTDRTIITTGTVRGEPTTLYIDSDGDGVVDQTPTAKANETIRASGGNDNNSGGGCDARGLGLISLALTGSVVAMRKNEG